MSPCILLVSNLEAPFVSLHREILAQLGDVCHLLYRGRRHLLRLVFEIARADLIVCWFVLGYATTSVLLGKAFHKPAVLIPGGWDVRLARALARQLGAPFIDVSFERHPGGFPDGERYVRLLDSVAGEHVVLVQTTHPDPMIVEYLLLADTVRDAGARRLTAIIPYYGYGC